ncbi:hypothetical protein PMI33_04447 [Pseudomonas sp. GM67]|nr:hypothetical protein PMI33_04447 [Pseudomonas sp. GM67]
MRRPDLPAKNDDAACLTDRIIVLRGQASLLQVPRQVMVCGTIPATFSHTRIDNAHDRPPHTPPCAQEA